MRELLDAVASWPSLLLALFVFGFAPGAALRLILLAYHPEDERRDELRAELYAVPRWERPVWVAEQLETAIFDGLRLRLLWMLTGRVIHRWRLGNGVAQNREFPESFEIPSKVDKAMIEPGDDVKAVFEMKDWGERMWVRVEKVTQRRIVGVLRNQPAGIPRLNAGDRVKLMREHVVDIWWSEVEYDPTVEYPHLAAPPESRPSGFSWLRDI